MTNTNILEIIDNEMKNLFKNENLEKILTDENDNTITVEYEVKGREKVYHARYDKRFETIDVEIGQFYPDGKTSSFFFKYNPYTKIQIK